MTESKPEIDFSRISFPSDKITLQHVREMQRAGYDLFHLDDDLNILREREEDFARLGFARRLGDAEAIATALDELIYWREETPCDEAQEVQKQVDILTREYVRFGVPDGPETARQLVRRLEAAGAKQAQAFLGK
jgi:hypothetical protein